MAEQRDHSVEPGAVDASARKRLRSARNRFLAIGAGLGVLAPLGLIVLRALETGRFPIEDLAEHRVFYLYEFVISIVLLAAFGALAGSRIDAVRRRRDWYKEKSEHDDLTGLLTPTAFRRAVSRAVAAATESREETAVVLLGVSELAVSERDAGSQLTSSALLHLAAAARRSATGPVVLARWAGVELGLLATGIGLRETNEMARAIQAAFHERPIMAGGHRTFWKACIGGVAGIPDDPGEKILGRCQQLVSEAYKVAAGIAIEPA